MGVVSWSWGGRQLFSHCQKGLSHCHGEEGSIPHCVCVCVCVCVSVSPWVFHVIHHSYIPNYTHTCTHTHVHVYTHKGVIFHQVHFPLADTRYAARVSSGRCFINVVFSQYTHTTITPRALIMYVGGKTHEHE